jgi:hypothetical protein
MSLNLKKDNVEGGFILPQGRGLKTTGYKIRKGLILINQTK